MVHDAQRGFIEGRILTDNVLELDCMTECHLIKDDVCVGQMYFDILAAFPSAAWKWIFFVLETMLCPRWLINLVKGLYFGSSSNFVLSGVIGCLIKITSGIKQGCPSSGSLWCILFDPIIRMLHELVKSLGGALAAFADDLGMSLKDVVAGLVQLVPMFDLISLASSLRLNWKKTFLINFSKLSHFALKRKVEETIPRITGITISGSGKYLGFMGGPDQQLVLWSSPIKKFLDRVRHIKSLGLALADATLAFKVLAFSILSFTFQLAKPNGFLFKQVEIAMDIVTSSPRYAFGKGILCRLRDLGFSNEFPDINCVSRASLYRVACKSKILNLCYDRIQEAHASDDALFLPRHRAWSALSSFENLLSNRKSLERIGNELPDLCPYGLQRKVYNILRTELGNASLIATLKARINHLFSPRIDFSIPLIISNIKLVSSKAPPFITSALVRSICNAWPTASRFKNGSTHCRFGCQAVGGDDFRHYPFCPIVLSFMEGFPSFNDLLWVKLNSLSHFLALHEVNWEDILRTAIWNDVILQTANAIRKEGGTEDPHRALHARLRTVFTRMGNASSLISPH
jgi:hypothetical protein